MERVTTNTPDPAEVSQAQQAVRTETHALLGATIQVSDAEWAGPSALPGWTRAELAAHIARHADAMRGLVEGALRGEDVPLYPSPQAREQGIRAGAGRAGLAIQEDLDTACGLLDECFDGVEDWSLPVDFRGRILPLAMLPLGRLAEVVLHHVDLAIGRRIDDIDPTSAALVLDWAVPSLAHRAETPALRLVDETGGRVWTTSTEDPTEIRGTTPHLLGWLAGRSGPEVVSGAGGVVVPAW